MLSIEVLESSSHAENVLKKNRLSVGQFIFQLIKCVSQVYHILC